MSSLHAAWLMRHFDADPTVERIDGRFELFACVGNLLKTLQTPKYTIAHGHDFELLRHDWEHAGFSADALAELAVAGQIAEKIGFIEHIPPECVGADSERTMIFTITGFGTEWYSHFLETYEPRLAAWRSTQSCEIAKSIYD